MRFMRLVRSVHVHTLRGRPRQGNPQLTGFPVQIRTLDPQRPCGVSHPPAVMLEGAGTKTTGIVRCDQPRALDLGARGGKKLESVPAAIMDEVLAKLTPIFE